jgi:hypothetical protein
MGAFVKCNCGASFNLKDEFAGKAVKCPQCGSVLQVPAQAVVDPAFNRDKFLLRQKHLALTAEKYYVWDEAGKPILYVQRPYHIGRRILALLAGAAVFIVVLVVFIVLSALAGEQVGVILILIGIVGGVGAGFTVGTAISQKRHVGFYKDDSQKERVLGIIQHKKVQILTATYTVLDAEGKPLSVLRKNYLYNFFRKRWYCYGPDGRTMCIAEEDSLILSLLRRFMGTMFGVLRTNFIIRDTEGELLGEFNRQFTILDRYVLDMSADATRRIDRRVALALGVMLDTGERR